jgi:protease-4
LTAEERSALEHEMEAMYGAFKRVVAEGREKSLDEVESLAQGRVWSGRAAHERGLVDELGGFDVALSVVRKRIGRGADELAPVVLRAPRRAIPPLDPPAQKAAELLEAVQELAAGLGQGLFSLPVALWGERVLAWADVEGLLGGWRGQGLD